MERRERALPAARQLGCCLLAPLMTRAKGRRACRCSQITAGPSNRHGWGFNAIDCDECGRPPQSTEFGTCAAHRGCGEAAARGSRPGLPTCCSYCSAAAMPCSPWATSLRRACSMHVRPQQATPAVRSVQPRLYDPSVQSQLGARGIKAGFGHRGGLVPEGPRARRRVQAHLGQRNIQRVIPA